MPDPNDWAAAPDEDGLSYIAHLLDNIVSHTSFVPIDILPRLPVELARSIFHFACSAEPSNQQRLLPISHRVASVCRAWRAIALADPILWASFVVRIDSRQPISVIQVWLERSSGAPLDITIIQQFERVTIDVTSTMTTLVSSIRRWRRLHIHVRHVTTLRAMISHISGTAPILEELMFRHDKSTSEDVALPLPISFTFPHLRILSIDCIIFSYISNIHPQQLEWPAHTLQSLSILHPSFDYDSPPVVASIRAVLAIAVRSPALNFLSLGDFVVKNNNDQQGRPAVYPLMALQKMTCDHISPDVIQDFFQLTETPSLDILEIVDSPEIPRGLGNICSNRFRSLRLVNTGDRPYIKDIRPLLFDCDDLYLSHIRGFDDSVILAMSRSHGPAGTGTWVCPHLVSLEIYRWSRFSAPYMRQMIAARQDASLDPASHVVAIKRLVVHDPPRISSEDWAWFNKNLESFSWNRGTRPNVSTSNVHVYETSTFEYHD